MALIEDTLFGHEDKIQTAIDRLQAFEPPEGYYLAFSGGKDSQCIYHLAKMAGVKFDAHYSVTTVDPPELMRFIKKEYPDVEWERHYWNDDKPEHYHKDGRPKQITMWSLIADHTIPPTRQARYCCSQLKETGGGGRVVVTGVRWAESVRRKMLHGVADIQTKSKKLHAQAAEVPTYKQNKSGGIIFMDDNGGARKMVEQCHLKSKTTVNPIVDWTDEDVWEFLNDYAKVPHCCLYDEGFTRLGCIGCPLQGREGMIEDFERWPRYKELYIRAFDKMIAMHPGEIKVATGEPAEAGGGLRCPQRVDQVDSMSSQIIQVERERERERERESQTRTTQGITGTGSSSAERGTWSTGSPTHNVGERTTNIDVVDVDAAKPERRGRAEPAEIKWGGGRSIRPLDLEFTNRQERTCTTSAPGEDTTPGTQYMSYWLWRCRNDMSDWMEPHPIRGENKTILQNESIIQIQK